MRPRPPLTPGQSHEAWARLHTLTTGVAMAGIAATAAIGAVAAADNPGKASGVASANLGSGAGPGDGPLATDPTAPSDLSSGGQATAPTTRKRAQASQPQPIQAPPRGSGHAHASSGGS